jgi:hypothetical protein
MNAQDAFDLIKTVQLGEFEDARLEVKRAQKGGSSAFNGKTEGKLPKRVNGRI